MGAPDDLTNAAVELAQRVADVARDADLRIAAAESLTGGKISCHLSAAPESASWYRGSVVAYSPEVKFGVLGVPEGPLVTQRTAEAMARGVAKLLGAEAAVAVSGVGGPDPEEGKPAGTVWMAVAVRDEVVSTCREYDSDEPEVILDHTTHDALQLLLEQVTAAVPHR